MTDTKCLFEEGKTYKTSGGMEALIYCVSAPCRYPIHGRLGGSVFSWTKSGKEAFEDDPSPNDLIPPPKPRRLKWLNIYKDGEVLMFSCKHAADVWVRGKASAYQRVACVMVDLDEVQGRFDPVPEANQ